MDTGEFTDGIFDLPPVVTTTTPPAPPPNILEDARFLPLAESSFKPLNPTELQLHGNVSLLNSTFGLLSSLKLAPLPSLDVKRLQDDLMSQVGTLLENNVYDIDVRYNETSNLTSVFVADAHVYKSYHFPTCYNSIDPTKLSQCHKPTILFFAILFFLICFISVFGNFLVLYVVTKSSRLHRPPSVFKASLAVADLLISLLVIPSLLYNLITNIISSPNGGVPSFQEMTENTANTMPNWFVRTVGSATLISTTASILTLLVMAVDRLVATRWPIYHRIHNSNTRAGLSISIVWIISVVPTLFLNIYEHVDFQLQPYTMTFGPTFFSIQSNVTPSSAPNHPNFDDLIIEPGIQTNFSFDNESIQEFDTQLAESLPLVSFHNSGSENQSFVKAFGIIYTVLCWLFPWFLTTCLTMGVGVYGWKSLRSIRTIGGHTTVRQKNSNSSVSSLDSSSDGRVVLDQKRVLRQKRSDNKNEDSSRRLVKTLSILVIMYSLCTLPLTILQLYVWGVSSNTTIIGGDVFRWVWFIATCLFLLQSSFNIFIYHRSKEFSEALRQVFRKSTHSSIFSSTRITNTNSSSLHGKRKLAIAQTLSTSDGGKISKFSTQHIVSRLQKQCPIPPSTVPGQVVVKKTKEKYYEEPSTVSTATTSCPPDSGMDSVSTNSSDIV